MPEEPATDSVFAWYECRWRQVCVGVCRGGAAQFVQSADAGCGSARREQGVCALLAAGKLYSRGGGIV